MDSLGPLRARAIQLEAAAARERNVALHNYETSARPALKQQAASLKESLSILIQEEAAQRERLEGLRGGQAVAGAAPGVTTGFNVIQASGKRGGAGGRTMQVCVSIVQRAARLKVESGAACPTPSQRSSTAVTLPRPPSTPPRPHAVAHRRRRPRPAHRGASCRAPAACGHPGSTWRSGGGSKGRGHAARGAPRRSRDLGDAACCSAGGQGRGGQGVVGHAGARVRGSAVYSVCRCGGCVDHVCVCTRRHSFACVCVHPPPHLCLVPAGCPPPLLLPSSLHAP